MKLAVVLPSRGLVYSKTVEELYSELESIEGSFRVFWSHGRPIPDCFTIPTEQALKGDYDYVLYVEEDMVLPKGILNKMLAKVKHAIACEYPVSGGKGGTVMYDQFGKAIFTGCGLLLVDTKLLRALPKPIWRTDVRWKPYVDNSMIHFTLTTDDSRHYGQQDVAFGTRLYANNLPIEIMDETIGQREMVKRGAKGENDGFHEVVDRMEVVQRRDLENIHKTPTFKEIVIDGKRVRVKPELFAKLDNPQLPYYTRAGGAIFDADETIKQWLLIPEGAYAR